MLVELAVVHRKLDETPYYAPGSTVMMMKQKVRLPRTTGYLGWEVYQRFLLWEGGAPVVGFDLLEDCDEGVNEEVKVVATAPQKLSSRHPSNLRCRSGQHLCSILVNASVPL